MAYKIGMIVGSLIGGGTQKIVEILANSMNELGHEVVIFTLKGKVEIPPGLRANVVPLLGRSLGNKRRELITAIKQGGEVGPVDLMLTHGYEGYRLMEGVDGVNCHHVVHNAFDIRTAAELKKLRIVAFARKYLKYRAVFKNKKLITASQGIADGLIRYFGVSPENVQTIYNPFDIGHIRSLGAESIQLPAADYMVHVGAFAAIKRHDLLLRAYATLETPMRLVLVGEGHLKDKIIALAQELGIADRVDFFPWQANPYPYIQNARLLVLSSDSEGLPTVVVEALILGTPVVSTDCPYGPSEILTGNLARFLVPRNDVAALAAAMTEALNNPPVINDAMVARFDHRFAVERYLELIQSH
jgi:glycosyltransferase involved in cell wall biosynthesis